MYLLGYDIGSSSIKGVLIEAASGVVVGSATSPATELAIDAPRAGFAEQDPEVWWQHVKAVTGMLGEEAPAALAAVGAIGISYQMHGLVLVDKEGRPLRPAIIWCDSRAVEIGERAAAALGPQQCLARCLNLPGNFTASKIRWVMENEPEIFARAAKAILPGDYIALRMTDRVTTTASGLSEGILWDFQKGGIAELIMDHYEIPATLPAAQVGTFATQGELTRGAAAELGLRAGIPIAYRAGDQPNNALSLNVLEPGEVAATAGTSGVVYAVTEKCTADRQSRVNVFAHVNHTQQQQRLGVLLCVNGTGILNSWLKHNVAGAGQGYPQMNELAAKAPIGAEGLVILPYGNGAERTLNNRKVGASIHGLDMNMHSQAHVLRAAQEGIVFAMNNGLDIIRGMGLKIKTVRAGHANMFLSGLFASAFATVVGATVELYNTDGARGAARGAGIGAGIYQTAKEAFAGLKTIKTIEPDEKNGPAWREAYERWRNTLDKCLS